MSVTIDTLVSDDLVILDLDAPDKVATIGALADRMVAAGRVTDRQRFVDAVLAREGETGGTGMESGVAIPHTKNASVAQPTVAIARVPGGVDFGSEDHTPSDLIFLIAAPEGADDVHITVLSKLARKLVHESFRSSLREASSPDALVTILKGELQ